MTGFSRIMAYSIPNELHFQLVGLRGTGLVRKGGENMAVVTVIKGQPE